MDPSLDCIDYLVHCICCVYFPFCYLWLHLRDSNCCHACRVQHCHHYCHCNCSCDCSCDWCCFCCVEDQVDDTTHTLDGTTYTIFYNDGTIYTLPNTRIFDNDVNPNVVPSAPSTDQIGRRNNPGLPVYFPDTVTEQPTPNETIDDIPTFEQVQG